MNEILYLTQIKTTHQIEMNEMNYALTSQQIDDTEGTVENDNKDDRISEAQHRVAEAVARELLKPVEKTGDINVSK